MAEADDKVADLMQQFDDPDTVGSAEYRAIYETIGDALEPDDPAPAAHTLAILNEFIAHANAMKDRLEG